MKEREIDLFDVAIEVLLHWRGILLLMLLGAVCMGGMGYAKSLESAHTQNLRNPLMQGSAVCAGVQTDLENPERLEADGIADVNMVTLYEQLYQNKLDFYKEGSVLMKLDPNKVWKAYMTFLIVAEDMEQTYNIEKVYENILCSGGLFEHLSAKHEIETSAVSEIVALENEVSRRDVGSNSFRMSVIHYDEDLCREIAKSVADYAAMQKLLLQEELGTHDIIILEQSQALVADTDIANRQKTYVNDIVSFMTSAARAKGTFTEKEQEYYESLAAELGISGTTETGTANDVSDTENKENSAENGDEAPEAESTVYLPAIAKAAPSVSFKYILLGMGLGAFAYAFAIFIGYLMNNKIRYGDDVFALYELPQLGQIPMTRSRRPLGLIDQWIQGLRSRGKRRFAPEEAAGLAAAAVKIAAKKRGIGSVTLIGCDIKGDGLETCRKVKALLEKEGIKAEILNNILYDAESMERLGSVEAAVLMEKARSTLYAEIYKECDLLERQEVTVLGGIVQE